MSAASLFATCVLIWGTTWYAITLAPAGRVLALHRSVKSRA